MQSVGLKVLKNKLSEYVRMAERGETVLVTDRDRVVAELVPHKMDRAATVADAVLADLVRRGWIAPPLLVPEAPPPRAPVASFADVLADLDRDREGR